MCQNADLSIYPYFTSESHYLYLLLYNYSTWSSALLFHVSTNYQFIYLFFIHCFLHLSVCI